MKFLFWWWLKQHGCFSHASIISLSNLMQSFKFIYILFFVFWILSPSSLCNFLTLNFDILKFPSWYAYIFIFLFFYLLQPSQWRSNYYNVNESKEMSQLLYFNQIISMKTYSCVWHQVQWQLQSRQGWGEQKIA